MGCFLSHHSLWQIAAASQDRFTAIFEDDVHVDGSLKDFLADDRWIPAECELVRFECSYNRIKLANPPLAQIRGRKLHKVRASNFEQCWPIGNGAYIISRNAAQKLIEVPEHLHSCGSDIFIYNKLESPIAAKIATCQIDPAMCIQDKFLHRDKAKVVYKSEIELTPPAALKESVIKKIWRKIRTAGLVCLGYRRVNFKGSIIGAQ
jgi:glycosyl transferase family 25